MKCSDVSKIISYPGTYKIVPPIFAFIFFSSYCKIHINSSMTKKMAHCIKQKKIAIRAQPTTVFGRKIWRPKVTRGSKQIPSSIK